MSSDKDRKEQLIVKRIYSGGDHSFATTIKHFDEAKSFDCRFYE